MDVRIFLIPMREHPPTIKANESAKYEETRRTHLEETRRAKYEETCSGNVDYRIQGTLHSAVQKEDSNRKEVVTRLIQQFETHPNREPLIEDLNKTEEFNPFSESRRSWSPAWVTQSTSSCARSLLKYNALIVLCIAKLASKTALPANSCSRRKGVESWIRPDTTSIPGFVTKRILPRSQTWTNYAAVHVLQSTRNAEESPKARVQNYSGDDDKYRKSLSDIVRLRKV